MEQETARQGAEPAATDARAVTAEALERYMNEARALRSQALYDLWEGVRAAFKPRRRRRRSRKLAH